jgi:signal transduction histidine kinase
LRRRARSDQLERVAAYFPDRVHRRRARSGKRWFGSIEISLSAQLSALFLLFGLACACLISYQLSNIDETARLLRLRQQVEEVRHALRFASSKALTIELPTSQTGLYQSDEPQRFYLIADAAGVPLLTSSKALSERFGAILGRPFPRGESSTAIVDGADNAYYFLTRQITLPVGDAMLTVGHRTWTTDGLLRDVERQLLERTALIAVPICFLALLASMAIIRNGFAPIRMLSNQAAMIGPANPGLRLNHADLPTELNDLVEAANEAAGRLETALSYQRRFTADAAHQLLTPLAIFSARLSYARDPDLSPDLQDDLKRMENLIRRLLGLSRVASAPSPHVELDLNSVARQAVIDMVRLAVDQGRNLSFEAVDGDCKTSGDSWAIGEALRNLILNALQHTAPGTTVEIEVLWPARIRVSDRGPGIAAEHLDRLFEPFFTTRRASGGSGLGLAIVSEVMRQHGGRVEAENRSGGGASFQLCFLGRQNP